MPTEEHEDVEVHIEPDEPDHDESSTAHAAFEEAPKLPDVPPAFDVSDAAPVEPEPEPVVVPSFDAWCTANRRHRCRCDCKGSAREPIQA